MQKKTKGMVVCQSLNAVSLEVWLLFSAGDTGARPDGLGNNHCTTRRKSRGLGLWLRWRAKQALHSLLHRGDQEVKVILS